MKVVVDLSNKKTKLLGISVIPVYECWKAWKRLNLSYHVNDTSLFYAIDHLMIQNADMNTVEIYRVQVQGSFEKASKSLFAFITSVQDCKQLKYS